MSDLMIEFPESHTWVRKSSIDSVIINYDPTRAQYTVKVMLRSGPMLPYQLCSSKDDAACAVKALIKALEGVIELP